MMTTSDSRVSDVSGMHRYDVSPRSLLTGTVTLLTNVLTRARQKVEFSSLSYNELLYASRARAQTSAVWFEPVGWFVGLPGHWHGKRSPGIERRFTCAGNAAKQSRAKGPKEVHVKTDCLLKSLRNIRRCDQEHL
jgi:hypothetical protein